MISIVDYGVGNLFSLSSSLKSIGADTIVTSDKQKILDSSAIILPGVGAFSDAQEKLKQSGLFDLIINEIPEPNVTEEGSLQFQPALLDYNEFVGRIGIGRVHNGKIKTGEMVTCCRLDGTTKQLYVGRI